MDIIDLKSIEQKVAHSGNSINATIIRSGNYYEIYAKKAP
jgi:hypothetical protein